MNEHEAEPVKGLPETLPDSEPMIWQGSPEWKQLAIRVFHVRKIAAYFALLVGVHIAFGINDGKALYETIVGAAWLALLGAASVAILGLLAWMYGKTTVYTITEQRLVMRFGVVIQMMINLPWTKIDAADLQLQGNSGDVVLTLASGEKASYMLLWPHVRPWHFKPVQPTLRCVEDAEGLAAQLEQVFQRRAPAAGDAACPDGPPSALAAMS